MRLTDLPSALGQDFDLSIVLGNEILPSLTGLGRRNAYLLQFPFPLSAALADKWRVYWDDYSTVLVYSRFVEQNVRRQIDSYGLEPKDIEVLAPPVQLHPFVSDKRRQILHVGRFFTGGHCKRQDIMIDAFRAMIGDGLTGVELHFAGALQPGTDHRAFYMALTEAAKDLPVVFHLNCSNDELMQLYATSRVYWHATGFGTDLSLQPEKAEHFGISVVEAMSAGCIPVVYATGGPAEIVIDHETGFTYETVAELVMITERLLEDGNRHEVEAMAIRASRAAQAFSEQRFDDEARSIVAALLAPVQREARVPAVPAVH